MEMNGRLVNKILSISIHLAESILKMGKDIFQAGNRTQVSRVTGGDTHHYTTEDGYTMTTMEIDYGQGFDWIRDRAVSCFQSMVNGDS